MLSLKNMKFVICGCVLGAVFLNGCAYKHFTHNQKDVLIDGVDIDQSLKIAEYEAKRTKNGEIKPFALGYWALRAQKITPAQAEEINRVYWETIETFKDDFNLRHFAWAIADIYRLGNDSVQTILHDAYEDAVKRSIAIGEEKHVADSVLYLGYYHFLGWKAAKTFMVVPGNRKFTQSAEDFFEKEKRKSR